MTFRIGWISPLSPRSGIGGFSKAVLDHFPKVVGGETIDVTAFYVDHAAVYRTPHRSVKIVEDESFREVLGVFDLLVYNIGNNREHHEPIYELLRSFPGVVVCHDHVYQHYLAERCIRTSGHFASYAALLQKFSGTRTGVDIRRSQITSRIGRIRYSPWDTCVCGDTPMSEPFLCLGSALVVHSEFSRRHAERHFEGPILTLGMPYDLRPPAPDADRALTEWRDAVRAKPILDLVSFGHIQSSKCIDLMIEAIGASADLRRRTRYTIAGFVGDGSYHEELRSRVQVLGLQNVVRFETGVSEARLHELMRQADIFVNLRRPNTEAASLSLIEQLDTGRPVVVVDSGCYAEIPDGAAVKLKVEPTPKSLHDALEGLVKAPATIVEIGRLGQRYGRTWSCQRYAQSLIAFALHHRHLIARRGKAVFRAASLHQPQAGDERWLRKLGLARAALLYLDRKILPIDPTLVMAMPCHELCAYVAEVIFGLFNDMPLRQAMSRYFARLDRHETYWACVRFGLLADAVFSGDERARARLINGTGCWDPEFWSVIETLPARQFFTTATLLIAGRMPNAEELEQCDRDEQDGFPIRSRLSNLLATNADRRQALVPLQVWAKERQLPKGEGELPLVEDVELHVGGPAFGDVVDLSGFHAIEPDRVWTRGGRGFIGLRLAGGTTLVEVQVAPLLASRDEPNEISLDFDGKAVSVELEEPCDAWLRLMVEVEESTKGVQWIGLGATRFGVPPNSLDQRVLGVCILALRVSTCSENVDRDVRREVVGRLHGVAKQMRQGSGAASASAHDGTAREVTNNHLSVLTAESASSKQRARPTDLSERTAAASK